MENSSRANNPSNLPLREYEPKPKQRPLVASVEILPAGEAGPLWRYVRAQAADLTGLLFPR